MKTIAILFTNLLIIFFFSLGSANAQILIDQDFQDKEISNDFHLMYIQDQWELQFLHLWDYSFPKDQTIHVFHIGRSSFPDYVPICGEIRLVHYSISSFKNGAYTRKANIQKDIFDKSQSQVTDRNGEVSFLAKINVGGISLNSSSWVPEYMGASFTIGKTDPNNFKYYEIRIHDTGTSKEAKLFQMNCGASIHVGDCKEILLPQAIEIKFTGYVPAEMGRNVSQEDEDSGEKYRKVLQVFLPN